MIRLPNTVSTWGTPAFEAALKQDLVRLAPGQLPLQQGLAYSSQVTERPIQAMLLDANEAAGQLQVRVGVFYTGVIAGCNCADDPTPVDELNEYCELQLVIDQTTAVTTVTLLPT